VIVKKAAKMKPQKAKKPAAKAIPISLAPLSAEQVLGALAQMPPQGRPSRSAKPKGITRKKRQ
jgi:hypothetical protein